MVIILQVSLLTRSLNLIAMKQINLNVLISPYNTVSFIISTHVLIPIEYIITPLHPYVQMITIALTVWLISW